LRGDLFKRSHAWEGDNLLRPSAQEKYRETQRRMIGIAIFNGREDLSRSDRGRKGRLQVNAFRYRLAIPP